MVNILTDQGELALLVASRRTGESLSYWSENDQILTVLFDQDPLPSWHQYRWSQDIIPGVSLLMDGQARMSDQLVAGIVIHGGLNHVLTYFYAGQWGAHYPQLAKRYNNHKARKDVHFLWKLYVSFTLVQGGEGGGFPEEQMMNAFKYYEAFGDIIEDRLMRFGASVHVPLSVDNSGMAYVVN